MAVASSTAKSVINSYDFGGSLAVVFNTGRLKERLANAGLSQSELARRIGVSQATVQKLVSGGSYGSKYIHRIARELGTTPAYLTGETDDPDEGASAIPELSADEHRLVTIYRRLPKKDQAALKLLISRMGGEA
jgi:transcriptional regulator with XRE-family HTH domain